MTSILNRPVLVLNKHWVVIGTTSVKGAFILMSRGSARGVCTSSFIPFKWTEWLSADPQPGGEGYIKSTNSNIIAPSVILLTNYGDIFHTSVKFSSRAMYRRDDYTCQYCKKKYPKNALSVDHVKPRSKNGKTSWENCVAACIKCNNKKADKDLKESGMVLMRKPAKPRWTPVIHLDERSRPRSWTPFLNRFA